MSQSAVLVATLAAAFVLYVAARGRLETYSAALLGPTSGGSGSKSGGGLGSKVKKGAEIAGTAAKVAEFL
jgi:hypothetical protein